jgi:hypothetical protein
VDDGTYQLIKTAADGSKRTISNFLEYATVSYLSQEVFVDDAEMNEIEGDKQLIHQIKKAENDIKKGKYRVVG